MKGRRVRTLQPEDYKITVFDVDLRGCVAPLKGVPARNSGVAICEEKEKGSPGPSTWIHWCGYSLDTGLPTVDWMCIEVAGQMCRLGVLYSSNGAASRVRSATVSLRHRHHSPKSSVPLSSNGDGSPNTWSALNQFIAVW